MTTRDTRLGEPGGRCSTGVNRTSEIRLAVGVGLVRSLIRLSTPVTALAIFPFAGGFTNLFCALGSMIFGQQRFIATSDAEALLSPGFLPFLLTV